MKCCVPSCEHSCENLLLEREKVTFHEFPTTLRHLWLESIGINESHSPEVAVVCSKHFQEDDFYVTDHGFKKLKNSSVPSVFRDKSNSSVVQVCMICLDTASKLYPFTEYLMKAYSHITGLTKNLIYQITIEPKLCTECAQRLTNCNKLRDKSLRAYHLLLQLYKKYGKPTLENITKIDRLEYNLKSNISKYTIVPDHFDFYYTENICDATDVNEENSSSAEQYSEVKIELNSELIIDSEVKEEIIDFDIDYEADCDLGDNFEYAHVNNPMSTESIVDSNDDVKCLDDDVDHDIDFVSEYDNCVKILNENIRKEKDSNKILNIVPVIDKNSKSISTNYVFDNNGTSNLTNVILIKDTIPKPINNPKNNKPINERIKFAKSAKTLTKNSKRNVKNNKHKIKFAKPIRKLARNDVKNCGGVVKPKTPDCSELKLFTVNVLTYEEQLAEVQRRKETINYRRSPYKCTICYKGYWYTNPYNRHMEKHTTKYGHLECAVCGFHMKTRRKLVTHIRINHDVRFSCIKCPFTSNNRSQVIAHEEWHNGKKYRCPHCDVEFAKRSSYLSHVRIKHPSDCVCALCGFSFVSEKGLNFHMNVTHRFDETKNPSGPACAECNVRFASDAAYQQHKMVSPKHAAEDTLIRNDPQHNTKRRPLYPNRKAQGEGEAGVLTLCELCGKSFRWPALLRQHMQVHTGEKRFKCDICDKRFMHKLSLKMHSERHRENPAQFVCGVCGKIFTNHSNRLRHMTLHRDARPYYKCDVCDKDFTSAQGRNAHMSHVHSNVPRPKRVRNPRSRTSGTRRERSPAGTSDSQDS